MENSSIFNRQFHDFLRDNLSSNHVSTELQLRCSSDNISPSASQPCTSYFQVSTKPGPNSLTEVTLTEVKKTQFLTSSSTLDRLLSFTNQDQSSLFRGGDFIIPQNGVKSRTDLGSQEFRLLTSPQNSLPFRREEVQESRNIHPLLRLQDSPRGGETQISLPKVPKNEPAELSLGRDSAPSGPPPGFTRKYGSDNGATVIPTNHFLPSHQNSSISLGRETQKKFPVPQTEPNNKYKSNSATIISPPPGFSNKNNPGGASAVRFDLNEDHNGDHNEQYRANGRIRSLPHPKFGPYQCPQCLETCPTSQHYAAHVSSRHKSRSLGERKKRHSEKFKNRKYKMVQCPDGLTVVPDHQSSNSINDHEVEVVLGFKIRNGVVVNQEIKSTTHVAEKKNEETVKVRTGISSAGKGQLHVREIKTEEEILEALQGPSARDLGKRRSPENWKGKEVDCGSSNDYKRNSHWRKPFGYLKRLKPS